MKKLADVDFRTFYKVNEHVAKTTPMRTHYNSKNILERWIWARKKETIKNILASISYTHILDAGCGDGGLYEVVHKDSKYTGIDISPTQLQAFREQLKREKVKRMQLIKGDICKLPFENNTFDAAVACDVLEHVLDPKLAISELQRVVKKNGYIIFGIPNETLLEFIRLMTLKFPLRSPDHLYALTVYDIVTYFPNIVRKKGIPFTLFTNANLLNIILVENEKNEKK